MQFKKNEFVIKSILHAICKWIRDIPILHANFQDCLVQTKCEKDTITKFNLLLN